MHYFLEAERGICGWGACILIQCYETIPWSYLKQLIWEEQTLSETWAIISLENNYIHNTEVIKME